jgi:hypothetical protein
MNDSWISDLERTLPDQAAVIARLGAAVESNECWRSLVVGCSLGAGRGDLLSDIDAGIGYSEELPADSLEGEGLRLVEQVGDVVDVLVHRYDGWPDDSRRFAVEYEGGVQLDLTTFRGPWRRTRDMEIAIVDKDGNLATIEPKPAEEVAERLRRDAREWAMLGWWAVSDAAKYLRRGSLYEATEGIRAARECSLRLSAAAGGIPDAQYGLTSLLDYEPFALPAHLAETYCRPDDAAAVADAAAAVAALLGDCAADAQRTLGTELSTPWSITAIARLDAARSSLRDR